MIISVTELPMITSGSGTGEKEANRAKIYTDPSSIAAIIKCGKIDIVLENEEKTE